MVEQNLRKRFYKVQNTTRLILEIWENLNINFVKIYIQNVVGVPVVVQWKRI